MGENMCGACSATTRDGAICWTCTGRVERTLVQLVTYLPELYTDATGLNGTGNRTGTISRTGHGPGIHVDPLDVASECRAILRPMAWDLAAVRGYTPPDPASSNLAAVWAGWLAGHVDSFRQHPAAPEWLDELTGPGRSAWRDPATGELVTFTRPPLVDYVLSAIDRHRPPRPLDADALTRARNAADQWVTVPVLMAALPVLLDEDTDAPNMRTVYEWANGRKATTKRRAVSPRLFKLGNTVRVGSVLDLIAERARV